MQKTFLFTVATALLNSVTLAIDMVDEAPENSILNLAEVQGRGRGGGRWEPPTSEECKQKKQDEADEMNEECENENEGDQTAIDNC